MVTSFCALIYYGLQFNERKTSRITTFFIVLPMFATFALARAFTLAVFLKETLDNNKTFAAGIVVGSLFCLINIGSYK
jgi:hypothetical protein